MEDTIYSNMLKFLYSIMRDSAKIVSRIDFYDSLLHDFKDFFQASCCNICLKKGDFITSYYLKKGEFSYESVKLPGEVIRSNPILEMFLKLIGDKKLAKMNDFKSIFVYIIDKFPETKKKVIPIMTDDSFSGLLSFDSPKYPDVKLWDKWASHISTFMGMISLHRSLQHSLRERGKETAILYNFCKISGRPDATLDELLSVMVKMLPGAWQYPEDAIGRIVIDGKEFITGKKNGKPVVQESRIIVNGEDCGYIEVGYNSEHPNIDEGPFLREERSLINALSKQLALVVEKKRIEGQSKILQEQLRHADRLATIGQLAAGVAHELNEPLGNILGFAQLVKCEKDLPPQASRDIEKIEGSTLYAREVIKKLMLFSRQMPPNTVHVNLNQIIDDGLYFLEARSAKAGIKIIRMLNEGIPDILADPSQLYQILVNIVVNAIQAIESSGEILIETGSEKNEVFFTVTDDGIGMSEDTVKKIFVPFFTTKDIDQGTGLGLPVCHGIVSAHGGRIEINSELGKGSTFKVIFPVKEPGVK